MTLAIMARLLLQVFLILSLTLKIFIDNKGSLLDFVGAYYLVSVTMLREF